MEMFYEDHKRLIFKLSWQYSNKCDIDIKDMISEMNVVFCEAYIDWNTEENDTFANYLALCCNNRFKNLMRSHYRKKRQMIIHTDKPVTRLSHNPEDSIIILDFMINHPNEIIREITKIISTYKLPESNLMAWLRIQLRKQNFKFLEIAEAFRILKTVYTKR